MNTNQTINGYRIDSRDKKSVKQTREFDYLLPKAKTMDALEALQDAVDEENKRDEGVKRWCAANPDRWINYDDPDNIYEEPTDEEAQLMCADCPLFQLCSDYAKVARPAFGVWAGNVYGRELNEKEAK